MFGYFYNVLNQVLSSLIRRMRLAGKDKLYWTIGVVHDGIQSVKVGKEQVGTLISGKTTGKTNGKHIITQGIGYLDNLTWREVSDVLGLFQIVLDTPYELGTEFLLYVRYLLIRYIVDTLKRSGGIGSPFFLEIFLFYFLPQRGCPSRAVYPIGYIANVQLLREITLPHILEDFTAHFAMEHTHPIDLLREVRCQEAHREFLMRIRDIYFT